MFPLLTALSAVAAPVVHVESGQPNYGYVSETLDIPIDEVVAIVSDCDRADEWFPDVLNTEVVSADGWQIRCGGATKLPWPMAKRTWQIDTDAEQEGEAWVLPFTYVEGTGNIATMHGAYRLEPCGPDRTKVVYEAWVDLGIWVPQCVLSWATRRFLPGVIEGIRRQHRTLEMS